jgi:hypothetical protein
MSAIWLERCSEGCCELEQAAQHRLATARHQRSALGRQDHAASERASAARKHVERQALTDDGSQPVALRAEWRPPIDPSPLAASNPEVDGGVNTDDICGGTDPVGGPDVACRARP